MGLFGHVFFSYFQDFKESRFEGATQVFRDFIFKLDLFFLLFVIDYSIIKDNKTLSYLTMFNFPL